MTREEAEQEAARRNREDPRARRLEFYAFDESAGVSHDAWEVTMRLRRGGPVEVAAPPPRPRPGPGRTAPPRPAPPPVEPDPPPAAPEPEPGEAFYDHAASADTSAALPETQAHAPFAEPWPEPEAAYAEAEYGEGGTADWEAGEVGDGRRPGRVVRAVGTLVILVAILWLGTITALAVILSADSSTAILIYIGSAVAGVLAVGLGFAIRRA